MATMNISLPDEMKRHVDAQVSSGQYSNASDYVRDLIRYDRQARDSVRAALRDGEGSGISPHSPEEILDALMREPN